MTRRGRGHGAAGLLAVALAGAGALGCSLERAGAVGRAPGAIDEPAVVAALDVHVDRVISGGRWCSAEGEGFYRAVVYSGGFEEVYHHLYVQLVRVDAEARRLTVVATVPVDETQGAGMVVSDLTLVGARGAECGEAIVTARILRWAGQGDRAERMQLRVDATGRYTVSWTPP